MSGFLQKPGGGGGGTWGSITGTLSDQTDLQAALNAKQDTLSLTTTGSSGASTLVGATLNVPTYTLSGLGGVPTSRTLTINGTAYDLSADRSWTISTGVTGSGTTNEIAYFTGATSIGSLSTATYPSLTELSYVKGVTSSIQTQLNSKGTFTLPAFTSGSVLFSNGTTIAQDNANFFWDDTNNRLGIGTNSPTARLHLPAGTATASTAPLKFTSGTNLTTAEAGAFEYDGNSLFFTPKGTLRSGILMTDQTNFNTYTQASKGATAFTSGTDNFLAGYIAGGLLTSGSQNVAIGNYAGYNFSNALGNVAIGYWANRGNASVEATVMIGYQTGYLASGASYSTFIGGAAGYGATNAVYSVFIGHQAGQYMSSGDRTVALGYYAGYSATNAAYSEFVGTQAGYFATNAVHGFFGGYQAGYGATNAANSVFIGQGAGRNATSAVESIFIGKGSGNNAVSTGVTGDYNIGLGTDTGKALTSGVGNTFIGYKVGDTVTTGSKNSLIGYDIDAQSNTADGQLSIQNAIFGTDNTGTGTTASTGKIGIYTVAPTCALDVTGGISTSRTTVTSPVATDGNIFSGTYTPTITGVTNVTSSTAYACQYMRVGNVVTVSGQVAITATTNNAQTTFGISLPIASNFGNTYEAGGGGYTQNNTVSGHGINLSADVTNDRINADYYETHGGTDTFNFTFTYQII